MLRKNRLKALAHVCPLLSSELQSEDEYLNESIFNTIENISLSLSESLLKCHDYNKRSICNSLFSTVLTDEGVCFSINALNSHEIYTDA